MWLDSRKFTKKDQLREVDVYVVIDDELEKEYDEFNRDYTDSIYIPENDLLHYYYKKVKNDSVSPHLVFLFGRTYFKIAPSQIDDLYIWMQDERAQVDGKKLASYITLVHIDHSNCYLIIIIYYRSEEDVNSSHDHKKATTQ